MYYHAIHGRHKTQTHVINAHTVHKECKSREVITAFNKQCMFISYKSIKYQGSNLAKFTVVQSLPVADLLPCHFDTQSSTIVAGFLPFIFKHVTEYSTVYTSMLNFVKIAKQLDQDTLPIFCDKKVSRILVGIYLQRKNESQILIQLLGEIHAAKCVEHWILFISLIHYFKSIIYT